MADKARVEGALGAALGNLFAVAENYPDLKATQNFLDLQKYLADIEDQIQLARRYYNGAARNLNILIASFPSNLVAGHFGFTPVEYFEIEDRPSGPSPRSPFLKQMEKDRVEVRWAIFTLPLPPSPQGRGN